jgi:hypothetical protein
VHTEPGAAKGSPIVVALVFLALVTVFLTWPQARYLSSKVAEHHDPHFSIWRIAWISHAIGDGRASGLFNANIFYPEPRTLAYSDATLLEGIAAAPLLHLGVHQILVYNLLLLSGIFASSAAMLWLCVRLTGSLQAAIVAAVIFGCLPYRIEHFMHLELQWTMWMPLGLLFLHDTIERGSWKSAGMTGACIGLQFLSSVYYGIFLSMFAGVMAVMELATLRSAEWRKPIVRLGGAALIAAAIIVPYAKPYRENARALGDRDAPEIAQYSASLSSYLASPRQNWFYGWTADRFGSNEARLFPGLVCVGLAIVSLFSRHRRFVWLYLVCALVSVELSLGFHGVLYRFLYEHVSLFRGLRAPARFGVLTACAGSVLAAFGAEHVLRRVSVKARSLVFAGCVAAILMEFASLPLPLIDINPAVPPIYQFIRQLEPGVLIELPVPRADRLPGSDPMYQYWSTAHWRLLVNGYSGYYPVSYVDMLAAMTEFPSDESIVWLKRLRVRYLVLHRASYTEVGQYEQHMQALLRRHDVVAMGTMKDWTADATLFELR